MGKIFEVHGSSWEMLKLPDNFSFREIKLAFPDGTRTFTVSLNVLLIILRLNGYACARPSIALVEATVIDCYKRHIASGGEEVPEGAKLLDSHRFIEFDRAEPPKRERMN